MFFGLLALMGSGLLAVTLLFSIGYGCAEGFKMASAWLRPRFRKFLNFIWCGVIQEDPLGDIDVLDGETNKMLIGNTYSLDVFRGEVEISLYTQIEKLPDISNKLGKYKPVPCNDFTRSGYPNKDTNDPAGYGIEATCIPCGHRMCAIQLLKWIKTTPYKSLDEYPENEKDWVYKYNFCPICKKKIKFVTLRAGTRQRWSYDSENKRWVRDDGKIDPDYGVEYEDQTYAEIKRQKKEIETGNKFLIKF